MIHRAMIGALAPLLMAALWQSQARAEPRMHSGTVVSTSGSRLTMKDKSGKEQSFTVPEAARVTVNGKPGKLEDLTETMPVQVTTDEKGIVLAVSTIDRDKLVGRYPFLVMHASRMQLRRMSAANAALRTIS
jgi:hypothetical protein